MGILFVSLVAFVVVFYFLSSLLVRKESLRRQARAAEYIARGKNDKPTGNNISNIASVFEFFVYKIDYQFGLFNSRFGKNIQNKLNGAGFYDSHLVNMVFFVKFILAPICFVAYGMDAILKLGVVPQGAMSVLIFGACLILFYAPDILVDQAVRRRSENIKGALPDTLDLLVICCEAGLSLDASLNRVAREIELSSVAMSEELKRTALELSFLPERKMALDNLSKRVQNDGIKSVVSTLVQSEKYGTPLSQSLRVLSSDLRDKRMLMAEEKAARLPAILTVPMIVFILPALFVVLAGPAAISVYDSMK